MGALEIARAYQDAIYLIRQETYSHPLESQMLLWASQKQENAISYLQGQASDELRALLDPIEERKRGEGCSRCGSQECGGVSCQC